MESSAEQPAGFPRCGACSDVIGVYEPLVHVFDGIARKTSQAAEPRVHCPDGHCYHLACYQARGNER